MAILDVYTRGFAMAHHANTITKPRAPVDLDALPKSTLLDEIDAANALDVNPGTLAVWRSTGRYNLSFIKMGRKVRYRVGDLLAFLESRTKTHTGQKGGAA
jgi:hypothetical protein